MDAFIKALTSFLEITAWRMETPSAYGPLHLTFMIVGFALSAFLAWKLRNVSDKGNRIIMLSVGIFLAICELYKQLLYNLVLETGAGYTWWIFPFHLCSVPMYLCLIVPFLKKGKVSQAMYDFMMTFNLLGGGIAFFEPSGLLHGRWTLTFHALIWHMMLVFVGLYIAFSKRGGIEKTNYKYSAITFVVLCAVAFSINCIFREASGGSINMFFVGPSNSSLIVFKQISEAFGWYVSTLLYIPATCLGAFVIFSIIRAIRKKAEKKKIAA